MNLIMIFLSFLALILIIYAIKITKEHNGEILDLYDENKNLRFENETLKVDLENAEKRTIFYARKMKKIENILTKSKNNKENYFITIEKLEKELFTDGNQAK